MVMVVNRVLQTMLGDMMQQCRLPKHEQQY